MWRGWRAVRVDVAWGGALGVLGLVVTCWGLGNGSLEWWDEGLSAERTRQMLESPAWFTQRNGQPIMNKPPGYYAVAAAVAAWCGLDEFAVRLPSAVCGALAVVAVFGVARAAGVGRLVALLAAVLLAGNPHWVNVARQARLETATGLAIVLGLHLCARQRAGHVRGALAGLVAGLGALFKHPLTAVALLAARPWRHGWRAFGVVLLGSLIGGGWWYLLAASAHEQAFAADFVHRNAFERLLRPIEGHEEDLLYYHRALAKRALVPYVVFVTALVVLWRRRSVPGWLRPHLVFVFGWLVLLHVAQTRLDWYVVPAYPSLALVAAVGFATLLRSVRTARRRDLIAVWALGMLWMFLGDKRGWDRELDFAPAAKDFALRLRPHVSAGDTVIRLGGPGHVYAFYLDHDVQLGAPVPHTSATVLLVAPGAVPATPPGLRAIPLVRGDGLTAIRLEPE